MGIPSASSRPAIGKPRIRVALIGCGAIVATIHAKVIEYLIAHESIGVVAVFDPDQGRRELIGARFPGCQVVDSLSQLPPDVNLAIVASPVKFHAQQTIALLRRGAHVLCEKPMALDLAECAEMIRAAEETGRLLAVGHVRRFYPASKQVRSIILGRSLGRPLHFRMVEGSRYQWDAVSDAYFRRESGGGALRDVGVHLIDLVLWWFGEPLDLDYRDDAMGGVEANARIRLSYPDGLAGDILLSRDWNLREQCFIQFERGWVSVRPNDPNHIDVGLSNDFVLRSAIFEQLKSWDGPSPGEPGATFHQAFIQQLLDVMRSIASGAPLAAPGAEGAGSIRLIEACYRSRRMLEMPWMSERELSKARTLA